MACSFLLGRLVSDAEPAFYGVGFCTTNTFDYMPWLVLVTGTVAYASAITAPGHMIMFDRFLKLCSFITRPCCSGFRTLTLPAGGSISNLRGLSLRATGLAVLLWEGVGCALYMTVMGKSPPRVITEVAATLFASSAKLLSTLTELTLAIDCY